MAGTVVVTTTREPGVGITRYSVAWTSTAGGAVSGNAFNVVRGRLLQVEFVPGSGGVQPSDLYDVTLVNANAVDVLGGAGANLSNAAGSIVTGDPPALLDGPTLDLVVAAAGNAKSGTVVLLVGP